MASGPQGFEVKTDFLEYYREGLFVDLELTVGTTKYNVHQLIIGNGSSVIANAIEYSKKHSHSQDVPATTILNASNGMVIKCERRGGKPWRGQLKLELTSELASDMYAPLWPSLIDYLYTGVSKPFTLDNIIPWFCITGALEVTTLKTSIIEWIISNVSKSSIFSLLPQVILQPRADAVLKYFVMVIAKNFSDFVEADRFTRQSKITKDTSHFKFDWKIFPLQAMNELLHDKNLFAECENDVFESVLSYLEKFQPGELEPKELITLFETVRFERLDYSTLESALAHPMVPKELLSRALMARLAGFEKPAPSLQIGVVSSQSSSNIVNVSNAAQDGTMASSGSFSPRDTALLSSASYLGSTSTQNESQSIQAASHSSSSSSTSTMKQSGSITAPAAPAAPASGYALIPISAASWPFASTTSISSSLQGSNRRRQSYGRLFQWSADFDTKGVLYYLATKEYRAEWSNPYSQKLVDVTWSSLEKGKPSLLFEREVNELWTQDVPSSWFTVDLGAGRSLRISAYTLRHGGSTKQDLIRNWTLKGSQDGKEFITLMRHKDDESLNTSYATHTWSISASTQSFRYFKIIQTGHNSTVHSEESIKPLSDNFDSKRLKNAMRC